MFYLDRPLLNPHFLKVNMCIYLFSYYVFKQPSRYGPEDDGNQPFRW